MKIAFLGSAPEGRLGLELFSLLVKPLRPKGASELPIAAQLTWCCRYEEK